jgi:hypothetical protein
MSLEHIVDGDFGQILELTFIDTDTDLAADISGYSNTIEMVFTSPIDVVTAKTATFKTDGSDGIIQWTTTAGFLTAGWWRVRGRVEGGTAKLTTVKHKFEVIS